MTGAPPSCDSVPRRAPASILQVHARTIDAVHISLVQNRFEELTRGEGAGSPSQRFARRPKELPDRFLGTETKSFSRDPGSLVRRCLGMNGDQMIEGTSGGGPPGTWACRPSASGADVGRHGYRRRYDTKNRPFSRPSSWLEVLGGRATVSGE